MGLMVRGGMVEGEVMMLVIVLTILDMTGGIAHVPQ